MTSNTKTRPKETAEPAEQQPMLVDYEEGTPSPEKGKFEPERFESFSILEGMLLKEAAGQINCLCCNGRELRNKGPGGGLNQGGFRLIQVQCVKCGTCTRLRNVLAESPELLALHQKGLKYFLRKGIADKKRGTLRQPKISFTAGTKRARSSSPEQGRPDGSPETNEIERAPEPSDLWSQEVTGLTAEPSSEIDWRKRYTDQSKTMENLQKQLEILTKQVSELTKIVSSRSAPPAAVPNNKTMAQPATSYAAAAAKTPNQAPARRAIQRRARAMMTPRSENPIEFEKLYIKSHDARSLKCAKSAKEANDTVREVLRSAGVKKDVFAFSRIGNSIIELYVPKEQKNCVRGTLRYAGCVVQEDFDAATPPIFGKKSPEDLKGLIVRRLAYLYRRARLANLKRCILEGFSEDICQAVRDATVPQAGATGSAGSQ